MDPLGAIVAIRTIRQYMLMEEVTGATDYRALAETVGAIGHPPPLMAQHEARLRLVRRCRTCRPGAGAEVLIVMLRSARSCVGVCRVTPLSRGVPR